MYAYRKFVRYEEAPPEPQKDRAMTELPDGLLPERPKPVLQQPEDPALREYNAYLAELARARCRKTEQDHRMTTPETPEARPATPVEKIRTALLAYRVMAWTTGIWLIALCYEIVSHYIVKVHESTDLDRRGARLGVFHLRIGGFQSCRQGPLADR